MPLRRDYYVGGSCTAGRLGIFRCAEQNPRTPLYDAARDENSLGSKVERGIVIGAPASPFPIINRFPASDGERARFPDLRLCRRLRWSGCKAGDPPPCP